jgi:hypothetical protein
MYFTVLGDAYSRCVRPGEPSVVGSSTIFVRIAGALCDESGDGGKVYVVLWESLFFGFTWPHRYDQGEPLWMRICLANVLLTEDELTVIDALLVLMLPVRGGASGTCQSLSLMEEVPVQAGGRPSAHA